MDEERLHKKRCGVRSRCLWFEGYKKELETFKCYGKQILNEFKPTNPFSFMREVQQRMRGV